MPGNISCGFYESQSTYLPYLCITGTSGGSRIVGCGILVLDCSSSPVGLLGLFSGLTRMSVCLLKPSIGIHFVCFKCLHTAVRGADSAMPKRTNTVCKQLTLYTISSCLERRKTKAMVNVTVPRREAVGDRQPMSDRHRAQGSHLGLGHQLELPLA